jgi:hypothetical protein
MKKSTLEKETEAAWDRYFSHQLSASEKAESRKRMLADLQKAKEEGVFREFRKLRGKIKWSMSLEELRKDDD